MSLFSVSPDLKVGSIVEVAGDAIRIEIDPNLSELTRTHGGDVYPVGQCGSVLKLHSGRRILFAYVRVLRMRSEIAFEEGVPAPPASEDSRIIEATLFAEGRWSDASNHLQLDRGVATYPLPGQCAYHGSVLCRMRCPTFSLLQKLALYGPPPQTSLSKNRIDLLTSTGHADHDWVVGDTQHEESYTETRTDLIKPKLMKNDILKISDHPLDSIIQISRGSGYSQFGGACIHLRSIWPMTKSSYENLSE